MQIDRQVPSASFKQAALTGKHIQDGSHCQDQNIKTNEMFISKAWTGWKLDMEILKK